MDFQLSEVKINENTTQLDLTGRLTAATSPQVRDKFKQLIDGGRNNILLDMGNVSFIDSSGLAALVSGLKFAREQGGWLRLVHVTDTIMQTLTLTRLNRVLGVYSNVEEALQG